MPRVNRDLAAGTIYVLLATAFLWFGRDYQIGSASRMGPGYFPTVLAWTLMGLGGISIIRSLRWSSEAVSRLEWRPLTGVIGGVLAFAILIQPLGLVFALPALIIISASTSREFIADWMFAALVLGLTSFGILVFVKGLGVPMPIFGMWFDGVVPSWLQN